MGCTVSTEAKRFDGHHKEDTQRWSYSVFGDEWPNARVFGKVIKKLGEKMLVKWQDGTSEELHSIHLRKEYSMVSFSFIVWFSEI